jgi:hypothetical protein
MIESAQQTFFGRMIALQPHGVGRRPGGSSCVDNEATRALKEAGYTVGLLGASKANWYQQRD